MAHAAPVAWLSFLRRSDDIRVAREEKRNIGAFRCRWTSPVV